MADTEVKAIEGRREVYRSRPLYEIALADVVAWCEQQGLDPRKMHVSGGTLRWVSPETDPEHAQRVDHERREVEARERHEREQYERLRAKFEGTPLSDEEQATVARFGLDHPCCDSHLDGPRRSNGMAHCCDTEDCGPCCEDCPTCPTTIAMRHE
jgi:hypothetical protein